jgi:AcrR family transcriptional regulator
LIEVALIKVYVYTVNYGIMLMMSTSKKRPYHHGGLRPALIATAMALVEESGVGAVSLRETARRVGVSAPATYRHFADKESLLAAVAAEGFRELGAELAAASRRERDSLSAMGMAYVRFALSRRGVFRLMFGPELAKRASYPELKSAADQAFQWLQGGVQDRRRAAPDAAQDSDLAAIAAWALVHGLAQLFLDGVLPETDAEAMTEAITAARRPIVADAKPRPRRAAK